MEMIDKYKKENKYILKMVVLGDVGVGKSNIIRRIMGQDFQELEATVGVEFTFIDIDNIDKDNPQTKISIQIWDTSGAERYRAITTSHIRNADGAYLVYDVTNQSSFDNIDFWLEIIKKATDDVVIYLVGNKADLTVDDPNRRKITKQQAIYYSKLRHFQGFGECSALKNVNIKETFESFYHTLYKKNKNNLKQTTDNKIIQLSEMQEKHLNNNKECCQ